MKPHINRDKMVAIRVRAGATIKLDVDIKGEPPPTKTWTFANKASTVYIALFAKYRKACGA